MATVKEIDALLPQTQCGECGYPGCRPYAEALAAGVAPIDRCPPGGVVVMKALAQILAKDPEPYVAAALSNTRPPALASIREEECIGCTKCITACPVDAIIGSAKLMHAVISHECTGCGLCVEPCPVDCIELLPEEAALYNQDTARNRFQARQIRHLKQEMQQEKNYRDKRHLFALTDENKNDIQAKQKYILEALARVQAKKA